MGLTAPIAVYGSSGYTGRLVVAELLRRELPAVLIGRSEIRLREVTRTLGAKIPIKQATLDDPSALRRALQPCSAVINCAGPFTRLGEAVIRAAIDSETHYLDTSGEQLFIQRVFEEFGTEAAAAGVALIPGMGFDYAPGDLFAHIVASDLGPLSELVIAYWNEGVAVSRGTVRTVTLILAGGSLAFDDGSWHKAGRGPLRASFNFPEPIGRKAVMHYPAGEIVTVPRHVDTRKVTSLIATEGLAPHSLLARLVPLTMPGISLALRGPGRDLVLSRLIDRLPEGPNEQERKSSHFTITATALARDGRQRSGTLTGSDPYGLTAVMCVEGARLMSEGRFKGSGTLAPAQAFNPKSFLADLKEHGLDYRLSRAERSKVAA